jgi:glucose/arabinose dehydrogenase
MTARSRPAPRRTTVAKLTLACLSALISQAAIAQAEIPLGHLEPIADGLDVLSNVAVSGAADRLFVVEQFTGEIRVVDGGSVRPEAFLDLGDRLIENPNSEEGLLGLAFPPDFEHSRQIYVAYIHRDGPLVLSRFEVDPEDDQAIARSEQVLLTIDRVDRVHNCGHVAFAADGLLYLCVGDTQTNTDIGAVAQDLDRPLGKILRLDPSPAGADLDPEIVAYGLRNPWGFAIDPLSGDLLVPDVGRFHWEEVNLQPQGESGVNYGWPFAEGNECVGSDLLDPEDRLGDHRLAGWATGSCEDLDLAWPVFAYPHDGRRCAIIGGEVYRGQHHPAWNGVFVFADYCSGEVWALRDAGGSPSLRLVLDEDIMPSAISVDAEGELVVVDGPKGAIHRLRLPDDAEEGWRPVGEILLEATLALDRAGTRRAKEQVDEILNSRRWSFANRLGRWYDAGRGLLPF